MYISFTESVDSVDGVFIMNLIEPKEEKKDLSIPFQQKLLVILFSIGSLFSLIALVVNVVKSASQLTKPTIRRPNFVINDFA